MNRVIVLALMSGSLAVPAFATGAEQSQPAQAPAVNATGSSSEKTPAAKPAGSNSRPDAPKSRTPARVPRIAMRDGWCAPPAPPYYPPKIVLKEKKESVRRDIHGAGNVFEGGRIVVTAEVNMLAAALVDSANAYAYALCHSHAGACLHLEQEFEVIPCVSGENVLLTMMIKLDGHLRTDEHGGATLKLASATVQPVGGGPGLALALAPRTSACGVRGVWRLKDDSKSNPLIVAPGRFILVADFVIEATADHFCHGHGEVDFAPDAPEGAWAWPDPIEKVETKDWGFTVWVQAENP
jgi:hypothetical protein